jgi:DNA-binding transcriptional LysR family regulator
MIDPALDLLAALDVLLEERHVTRAARRLGITQSAMSQRLRKLREAFGDPLLIASGRRLVPTARAERLAPALRASLDALRDVVRESATFEPASSTREFVLGTSDYGALLALPAARRVLEAEAPGIELVVVPHEPDLDGRLARGELDLAIGGGFRSGATLVRKVVAREGFVVLARKGHPALRRRLTLEAYLRSSHLLVSPRGARRGIVDDVLAERGLRRRIAMVVPQFVVAPFVAARSDLLLTAPVGLARALAPTLDLAVRPPPLSLPETAIEIVFHARQRDDPGHRWLRDRCAAIVASLLGGARGRARVASPEDARAKRSR